MRRDRFDDQECTRFQIRKVLGGLWQTCATIAVAITGSLVCPLRPMLMTHGVPQLRSYPLYIPFVLHNVFRQPPCHGIGHRVKVAHFSGEKNSFRVGFVAPQARK